jgi:hypothetical protein
MAVSSHERCVREEMIIGCESDVLALGDGLVALDFEDEVVEAVHK